MTTDFFEDSRVVLMCGVSGSGKTYYSHKLMERGYERLSPDELIWNSYGAGFTSLPFDQQKKLFIDASREIVEMTINLVESGKKVVVDSTMCKRFKRDEMREACLRHGIEPVIVYMKAPYPLLEERLSTRKGSGPDDLIVSKQQLRSFFSNFEIPSDDEKVVIIDQSFPPVDRQ